MLIKLELFLFLCGNWTEQSECYFEQNYPLQDFEEMLQNFRLSTKEFQECSDDVVISQPTDPSFVPSCFGFQSPKLARLS